MTAGVLLLVGVGLLIWGYYRFNQWASGSARARFWLPGKDYETGDFWSIAKWAAIPVILGVLLLAGGLPGLGGGSAPSASSPASAAPAPEKAPKYPRREPDGRGGVTVHVGPDSWYWIDSDGQVTRSRGKGCRFHPGASC